MKKHEATEEELEAEWKRIEEFWHNMTDDPGTLDYPWVKARFMVSVFNTMLSQRGWKVLTMLGGRPGGV